jgi:RNA polymerase sigma-70 factor (ECF subfamily)
VRVAGSKLGMSATVALESPRMAFPDPDAPTGPDEESRAWVTALSSDGAIGDKARRDLHLLLLRAARFEIRRRRGSLPHLRGGDLDDLAHQSADDALLAVLAKLDHYRGDSRFTTWAYKFALLEAAVTLRRRAWQGREIPVQSERWATLADGGQSPAADVEQRELLRAIAAAMKSELSAQQRQVLVAVALDGVPIDVLAERMNTTRGALYKSIHDARQKLRTALKEVAHDA